MRMHMKNSLIIKQRGSGLVELMVSMAIGLILVLGVSTVFLSVNKTFKDRKGLAELQNSERLAMSFISAGIHNAGYYPNPLAVSPIAANQVLVGTGDGISHADTLTIRFVAPSGASISAFQGCTATLIPNNIYTDTFSVSTAAPGYLVCTETNITTNVTTTVNLITGLTGMDINYGVDTTGAGSVTTYRPATTATWGSVKTVVVKLSFSNPLFGPAQPKAPQTVSLTQTISNLIGP